MTGGRGADEIWPIGEPVRQGQGGSGAPESFRLLIVAEDDALRHALSRSLSAAGFQLEQAVNAAEAMEAVRLGRFDLVLLEFRPPDSAGIETCQRLRVLSADSGIVMIRTGGAPEDEVVALDAGADDCIAAPFRFREIVARLGAVLRRVRVRPSHKSGALRAGDLELDPGRRLLFRGGEEVHLSPREFDLLLVLMKNQEQTLTHVRLLRSVWGNDSGYAPGYLRSYIKALRKKIEPDPAQPRYILTEPWAGYRFHNPETDRPPM